MPRTGGTLRRAPRDSEGQPDKASSEACLQMQRLVRSPSDVPAAADLAADGSLQRAGLVSSP